MMVKRRSKKSALTGLGRQVFDAINSVKKYKYRSALGLSEQMNMPLEHVEFYLVDLAQKGLITIGVDNNRVLWASGEREQLL